MQTSPTNPALELAKNLVASNINSASAQKLIGDHEFISLRELAPRRDNPSQTMEDFRASLSERDLKRLELAEKLIEQYQSVYKHQSGFSEDEMECESHLKYLTKPGASWDIVLLKNGEGEVVGGMHINMVQASPFNTFKGSQTAHIEQFWAASELPTDQQQNVMKDIFGRIQNIVDSQNASVMLEMKEGQIQTLPDSARLINMRIEQCSFDSPQGDSVKGFAYALVTPNAGETLEIKPKNFTHYLKQYQDWADPADADMARMQGSLSEMTSMTLLSPKEYMKILGIRESLTLAHDGLSGLAVSRTTGVSEDLLVRGPLECLPVLPTEVERQGILDKAKMAVFELLEHGRGISFTPEQCAFGVETEFSLVNRKDGHLAKGSAGRVASLIQTEDIHSEAGTASVEIATPAFASKPGGYAALLNNLRATFESVRTAAAMRGWSPVCTGIPQILSKGELNQSGMLDQTPQIAMEGEYWEKVAEKAAAKAQKTGISEEEDPGVELKIRGSEKTAYHFDDGVTVWTGMNSLHVTSGAQSQEHAVSLYNAYVTLTPTLMGISANAGTINGNELEAKDVRPFLAAWSKDDFRYNQEYSLGTVVNTISSIEEGFMRVIPEKPTVGCPSIQLTSGAEPNARDCFETVREITYPSIHLRFSNQDPRQVLIEYRPMSVQLTPEDNAALAMFTRISADYLANNPDHYYQPTARMVNNDTKNALRDGMNGKVVDIFADQSQYAKRKRIDASDLALRLMDKAVGWQLAEGRINQDDVAVLAPLRKRLLDKESCADTVAKAIKEKGLLSGVLSLS